MCALVLKPQDLDAFEPGRIGPHAVSQMQQLLLHFAGLGEVLASRGWLSATKLSHLEDSFFSKRHLRAALLLKSSLLRMRNSPFCLLPFRGFAVLDLQSLFAKVFDLSGWFYALLRRFIKAKTGQKRSFEVERKFSISAKERTGLPNKLRSLSFRLGSELHMTDTFIPTVVDGEMCRVREEVENHKTTYLLTRKTWVSIAGQREREEREEELSELTRDTLIEIGERLQNGPLLSFSKERHTYTRSESDCTITVALDVVDGLGEYSGDYMEIEILIQNEADVPAARESIVQLAQAILGEQREPVQMSYMDMLKKTARSR